MQERKNITLLSGDGIGKEVIQQAKIVLDAIKEKYRLDWDIHEGEIGQNASNQTGDIFPVESLDLSIDANAILLGPTVYKGGGNEAETAIVKTLNSHTRVIPIRPIRELEKLSPIRTEVRSKVNFVIFESLNATIDDTLKLALESSEIESDLITVIENGSDIGEQKGNGPFEYISEDQAVEILFRNPSKLKTIVCSERTASNIKRIASLIVGSKAVISTKIVGGKSAIYKPLHNTNPCIKDRNVANPIGAICALGLMLRDLRQEEAAQKVYEAIDFCMNYGLMTEDLEPTQSFSTTQIGQIIAVYIQEGKQGLKTRKFNEALSTIV